MNLLRRAFLQAGAATVYTQLGVDIHKKLMASGGRPVDIVYNGRIIQELIA